MPHLWATKYKYLREVDLFDFRWLLYRPQDLWQIKLKGIVDPSPRHITFRFSPDGKMFWRVLLHSSAILQYVSQYQVTTSGGMPFLAPRDRLRSLFNLESFARNKAAWFLKVLKGEAVLWRRADHVTWKNSWLVPRWPLSFLRRTRAEVALRLAHLQLKAESVKKKEKKP